MATTANKCRDYKDIKSDPKWYIVDKVNLMECCIKDPKDDPKTADCCYNTWSDELKLKRDAYAEKTELAAQAKERLAFLKGKRDGFKKWFDDLQKLHENAKDICDQFELIISQVCKICESSRYTVKAVDVLYCMIRDYYSQVDKVKYKYDRLIDCIKGFDVSILVPKTGLMKCLENYYEKLIAVVNTKDLLLKQIMDIIKLARMVHEDVCSPFGLSSILEEWKCRLHCKNEEGETKDCRDDADSDSDEGKKSCDVQDNLGVLYPELCFPIISKQCYWQWLKDRFDEAERDLPKVSKEYLDASKEKESIAASIASLEAATAIANPKDRCN